MRMNGRMTVAGLRAQRGDRQLAMLRVETLDEAAAAERAGIDMVSIEPDLLERGFRKVAPTVFAIPGLDQGTLATEEDFLRTAYRAMAAGADAVYCAASLPIIERLAAEGVPVCGHTGLIPSRATWTGGFRAVGKTLETAQLVFRQAKALENAGAFAAEIEVVPEDIASAIHGRTSLILISMGAGAGCDAQYLFADDVLGQNTGHVPRHAKVYRNFAAEFERLQEERVAAFREYACDVTAGTYPETGHKVPVADDVLYRFREWLDSQ